MSDQPAGRGSQRGGRGRGIGGSRGPHQAGGGGRQGMGHGYHSNTSNDRSSGERPKKENILNLERYMDKQLRVKFNGGREVVGLLKGYDQLMNLVLDEVMEISQDEEGNDTSRKLGLVVARSTLLTEISPVDGSEQIANPFTEMES